MKKLVRPQFGWAGEKAAVAAYEQCKDQFSKFNIVGSTPSEPGPPIWEYAKKLNGGQHLPTWQQESGDCVSMGMVQAGQYSSVYEIIKRREEEQFKFWYPPFIYGTSRVQIGGGMWGPGSTGAWAAAAVKQYGVLFEDDRNVPSYSGRIADRWGRSGPPREFLELASDNLVKTAAPLDSVDEIRESLLNYHMVTVASNRGFSMQPYEKQGYHVGRPRGRWPHQMCFIAWMDKPFKAAYRMNSWGPNAHGNPFNGEPAGGFWNLASDIEAELRRYDVELYAISAFDGFPAADIDYSIL